MRHVYTTSYRYQVVGTMRDEKAKCPVWVQEVVQVRRTPISLWQPLSFLHTASFPGFTPKDEVEL